MHYFLGVEFKETSARNILSQREYVLKLLYKFNMTEFKVLKTPMSSGQDWSFWHDAAMAEVPYEKATGRLLYLSTCTRPEIFSVSFLAGFAVNSPGKYYTALKRICDISDEQATLGRGMKSLLPHWLVLVRSCCMRALMQTELRLLQTESQPVKWCFFWESHESLRRLRSRNRLRNLHQRRIHSPKRIWSRNEVDEKSYY